jgi:hypothetical protein
MDKVIIFTIGLYMFIIALSLAIREIAKQERSRGYYNCIQDMAK